MQYLDRDYGRQWIPVYAHAEIQAPEPQRLRFSRKVKLKESVDFTKRESMRANHFKTRKIRVLGLDFMDTALDQRQSS
jgi:hypothetical protein